MEKNDKTIDKLLSKLNDAFKKDEQYKFLNYVNKNTGVFLSAISIIAAIVLFIARTISYLVVYAQYNYWNIGVSFLVEDNKAYLKLGVYVLYFLLFMLLSFFSKRYVYRLELLNFKAYLYGKIFKNLYKKLRLKKDEIHELKKHVNLIERSGKTLFEERVKDVNTELSRLEKENKELRKETFFDIIEVIKIKFLLLIRLIPAFLIIFFCSLLLQLFFGVTIQNSGIISVIISTSIIALIVLVTAIINAFFGIRVMIKVVIKQFFNGEKVEWSPEYIIPVIEWMDSKISEQKEQNIKQYFSDKALKQLACNVLITTFIMTIFLQFNVKYSLSRADSFYVLKEAQQNYVLLINDGTKYILSECDILDGKIIINTNEIIVRNEPIQLKKEHFESIEKK